MNSSTHNDRSITKSVTKGTLKQSNTKTNLNQVIEDSYKSAQIVKQQKHGRFDSVDRSIHIKRAILAKSQEKENMQPKKFKNPEIFHLGAKFPQVSAMEMGQPS